jgi:uncharacterized membrane protein
MTALSKETTERVAAFGAVAVSAVLMVLLALFVLLTFPRGNGIDTTEAVVAWVSVGMVILTVIACHLVYARVLYRASKGK